MEPTQLVDEGLEILSPSECLRLLEETHVGRVVLANGALPVVFPVNYVLVGDDITFFTGEGMKLRAAASATPVTFQVDHIDLERETGWSVLATGQAQEAAGSELARATALGLRPWAAGMRTHLIRIRPDVLTGRRILT
jgi:nitroimidazol reductase NimA-like FMN-containing flavoprotein (pyridoxamine 5'-phosphate oxidase superfamily)